MKNVPSQLSLFLLISLFIACGGAETNDGLNREDIIPVKLIPLQEGENANSIQTSGVFTTEDEAVLSFKNGGIVQQITVNEGDHVNKGQLLAKLNMTEINTGVQQTDLALEKAERDYKRAQQLFSDSVATREQLENAKTVRDIAIQQNKAAQFNQNFSEIRASTNGYILKRFVNEGQTVGPGTPILQVNGAGNTDWKLKVGVSDQQWALLSIGDEALIESNLAKEKIKGQVLRKSEGIDPSSGTFTITLKINTDQDLNLASGAFARATIYPSNKTTGWKIPYDALLDGNANHGFVFVTNDKKTAKKVEVTLGAISKDGVMVLSGLEGSSYLIISGSAYLSDGSKINAFSNQDSLNN